MIYMMIMDTRNRLFVQSSFESKLMAGGLMGPLVAAGLFWAMLKFFRRRYKRDPKDTYLNWKPGMAPDRLFNIIYFTFAFVSAVVVPAAIHASAKSLLTAIGFQP